ncbi:MAG TPA: TonB-dependent receptor [Pyrinomonadaceae bacterium]|nr:TonB-dependent receptor [Pyrinomonadaceae bacterium]
MIFAQSFSGVTGVVTDANGAVVPGVAVTLTDTKTQKDTTTKSNDQGVYQFTNIPPGEAYKLTFSLQGFQTLAVTDVILGVSRTETHNVTLSPGEVSVTVEVNSSNDVTLNTTDPSIGNVIGRRQLHELPIQIRNSPAALLGLQPGVIGNNVGTGATNRVGSVTGSRTDQGNITIDGIDANDQATGQAFATVGNAPIDSIQEFRGTTANPTSAQGRSSGGQIELVTNSGTNDFHGSLREYNRTAATAANSFFNNKNGVAQPQLTRNQFGGSLGGPILKNKLFFFFDFEGRRDATGVSYTRIVPLAHLRGGSVGYINNTAGCTAASRLNTTPGCISFVTPAQIATGDPAHVGGNAPLISFVNSRYPLPNDFTIGDGVNTGGFRFNAPSRREDNTYTTRIDWNMKDNQRIFGRLTIARRNQTDTINSVAAQFPGDPDTALLIQKDYGWAIGHGWTINSNLINQITVGVTHSGLNFDSPFAPASPQIYTFGPITAPYAGIDTQDRFVDTPTIRDDVTWTRGSHTLLFGTQIKPIRSQSGIKNDFNFVTLGLGGNTTTLNAALRPGGANFAGNQLILASTAARAQWDSAFAFLLGRIGQVDTNFNYDPSSAPLPLASGKHRDYRYNEYEFYFQDNWKVRSDLNVNLGVRWQYYQPPFEANGFQAAQNVDWDALYAIRVANAAAGIASPTSEPLLAYDLIGPKNGKRDLYKADWNNFGPRIGFAWNPSFKEGFLGQLFGDRKTVIRGGGSITYDRVGGGITFIQDQVTYLFDGSSTSRFGTTNPITSLQNDPRFTGLNTLPVSNTAPTISHPFVPFTVGGIPDIDQAQQQNYTITENFEVPFSYQFSLGFERELPGDMLIDVSYVGRLGRKLFAQADTSQVTNFRDNASGQLFLTAFNTLQREINAGGPITSQPWFENQIGPFAMANYGHDCAGFFGDANCTEFVATFIGDLVGIGDASDTAVALYSNALLNYNVAVNSQFATNSYITNTASSNYHGMLVSLQKRFSKGLQFDLNYTWSHSLDNQSSVTNTVFGGLICDLNDLSVCRGPSDFDIRHLVNANFIYELPFGKGKYFGKNAPGWLDQIIGGWTVSGIYTYRSGLPFSTTTGSFPVSFLVDSPGVLVSGATSSALSGQIHNVPSTGGDIIQMFGPNALSQFRNPIGGETGNRNVLRSGSYWGTDIAVLKNFKLPWEGQKIQVRWESYNAFNHNVFGIPAADINDPGTFGQITGSASTPREMQFAIRYDF